jgi:hypothetical protein
MAVAKTDFGSRVTGIDQSLHGLTIDVPGQFGEFPTCDALSRVNKATIAQAMNRGKTQEHPDRSYRRLCRRNAIAGATIGYKTADARGVIPARIVAKGSHELAQNEIVGLQRRRSHPTLDMHPLVEVLQ